MPTARKSALHSALVLTASSIGLQLIGFGYRVFISRVTGPEGLGVLQLVMPVYSVLISVTFTGLTTAVTNIASERSALGDAAGMRQPVAVSIRLFLALFVAAAVPLVLFSDEISAHVLGDAETRLALLIMLPCLLLTGFENIYKSWFYGVKNVKPPAVSDQMEQVVRFGAVAGLLLWFRPDSPAMAAALIVAGMTISELFSSTLLGLWYRRARPRLAPAAQAGAKTLKRGAMLKKVAAVAAPIAASSLAGNLLSSANAVLVPQRLMAAGVPQHEAVGALGIALGMALPLFMLPMAFMGPLVMVMLPRLSEGSAMGDKADVHRKMGKAFHATGLLALPAVALLAPIGPAACRLLYGQELPLGYLLLMAAAMVFSYYQMVTGGMMNGTGLQGRAMANTIIGDVVQLAITWFAVADPSVGIYGFLWGMLAGSVISAALNVLCLTNRTGLSINWPRWIAMPWLAAAAVGLASGNVFGLMSGLGWAEVPAMLWAVAAGSLVFLLCLRIQGIRISGYVKALLPRGGTAAAALGLPFYFL